MSVVNPKTGQTVDGKILPQSLKSTALHYGRTVLNIRNVCDVE